MSATEPKPTPDEHEELSTEELEAVPELSEIVETKELEKALIELDDLEAELYPEPQDLVEAEESLPTELHSESAELQEVLEPASPVDESELWQFKPELRGLSQAAIEYDIGDVNEPIYWTDDELYRRKRARELGLKFEPEEYDEYY